MAVFCPVVTKCRDDKCNQSTSAGRHVSSATVAVLISETWPEERLQELFGIATYRRCRIEPNEKDRMRRSTVLFLVADAKSAAT